LDYRLKWYVHVLKKDENDWVKKCIEFEVGDVTPRGRPKKTWSKVIEKGLSDPTNMQGRCCGPQKTEEVN